MGVALLLGCCVALWAAANALRQHEPARHAVQVLLARCGCEGRATPLMLALDTGALNHWPVALLSCLTATHGYSSMHSRESQIRMRFAAAFYGVGMYVAALALVAVCAVIVANAAQVVHRLTAAVRHTPSNLHARAEGVTEADAQALFLSPVVRTRFLAR